MKKKVVFGLHALQRIEERGITTHEVIEALENPDKILNSFKERILIEKYFPLKKVCVIYKEKLESIIVITVY